MSYETDLQHLVRMASIPGFKDHAWRRAKQMDADSSGLWAGIAQALSDEMKRRAAAPLPS